MHIRPLYAGWHAGQWRMPSFIASPCSLGRAPALPVAASRAHAPTGVAGVALAAALALAGCASAPSPTPTPAAKPVAAATPPTASPTTAATPPQASPDADHTAGFAQWLSSFSAQALEAGIRPATVRDVLGKAQWLPRVVELDRAQPEFTRTPWAYLDSAVSPQRIAQGQAQLATHGTALQAAAARYGVPANIVTAIWGMESNYGSNFGTFRTVDALATLAYEGRRRAWAQTELLAALRIIDQGDIAADRMIGSWAGAMGHTQFLPSVFLAYAVDADGDGHRDIWGSVPDVTASTAHFLARSGWKSGEPWGAEVQLPPPVRPRPRRPRRAPDHGPVGGRRGAVHRRGAAARPGWGLHRHPCGCKGPGVSGGQQLPHHPALQQLGQLRAGRGAACAADRRRGPSGRPVAPRH